VVSKGHNFIKCEAQSEKHRMSRSGALRYQGMTFGSRCRAKNRAKISEQGHGESTQHKVSSRSLSFTTYDPEEFSPPLYLLNIERHESEIS